MHFRKGKLQKKKKKEEGVELGNKTFYNFQMIRSDALRPKEGIIDSESRLRAPIKQFRHAS